jgi:hypothetical protein
MGNSQSIKRINFEDMQAVCKNNGIYLLINTLPENEQQCLIPGSINYRQEEELMNKLIRGNKKEIIIIYGKNCNDDKVPLKYRQLITLGFFNVYVYNGGLFEWLMLQDIYGNDEFPTTTKELDILKYKPYKMLGIGLLNNI